LGYVTSLVCYALRRHASRCRYKKAEEAIQFSVIVLVASIPLALEIVVTTTLALGSRELARDGAIVTRLAAIEDLAGMNILCSDKTGTLTMNKMMIQQEAPTFMANLDQYKVCMHALSRRQIRAGACPQVPRTQRALF
jgi:H+-transporting ATPase